jgi:hypothetical protein
VPEINWPVDKDATTELGILVTWMPAVHRNFAGQVWDLPKSAVKSNKFLIKNDGSIWRITPEGSHYLSSFVANKYRLALHSLIGEPVKELPFIEPTHFVLHAVLVLPSGWSPRLQAYVDVVQAESSKQHAAQPDVATNVAPRMQISLPDELVARVREKIAELAKDNELSDLSPDEQPF